MKELLTIENIAQILGIGKTTTYKLVKKIAHVRVGRKILVLESDLMEYIENNKIKRN